MDGRLSPLVVYHELPFRLYLGNFFQIIGSSASTTSDNQGCLNFNVLQGEKKKKFFIRSPKSQGAPGPPRYKPPKI